MNGPFYPKGVDNFAPPTGQMSQKALFYLGYHHAVLDRKCWLYHLSGITFSNGRDHKTH